MKRVPDVGWAEGGLLIHKSSASSWWHVTHQASGRCVDTGIDTRAQAVQIVQALLDTGLDFTRDVEYLELHKFEIVGLLNKVHEDLSLAKMSYV